MAEVADFDVIECDGRKAVFDFKVWDSVQDRLVDVRVTYQEGDKRLTPVHGIYYDLALKLADDEECIRDARETLAYRRDELRDMN